MILSQLQFLVCCQLHQVFLANYSRLSCELSHTNFQAQSEAIQDPTTDFVESVDSMFPGSSNIQKLSMSPNI